MGDEILMSLATASNRSKMAKITEFLFIGFWVFVLPIWFPLLILYVVADPVYYWQRWRASRSLRKETCRSGHLNLVLAICLLALAFEAQESPSFWWGIL